MSSITKLKLEVTMDDGTEYTVYADQRDLAAWEAASEDGGGHTMVRYYAWSAMRRAGQYAKNFKAFNEIDCVQAASIDESKPAEGGEDPTKLSAKD